MLTIQCNLDILKLQRDVSCRRVATKKNARTNVANLQYNDQEKLLRYSCHRSYLTRSLSEYLVTLIKEMSIVRMHKSQPTRIFEDRGLYCCNWLQHIVPICFPTFSRFHVTSLHTVQPPRICQFPWFVKPLHFSLISISKIYWLIVLINTISKRVFLCIFTLTFLSFASPSSIPVSSSIYCCTSLLCDLI